MRLEGDLAGQPLPVGGHGGRVITHAAAEVELLVRRLADPAAAGGDDATDPVHTPTVSGGQPAGRYGLRKSGMSRSSSKSTGRRAAGPADRPFPPPPTSGRAGGVIGPSAWPLPDALE